MPMMPPRFKANRVAGFSGVQRSAAQEHDERRGSSQARGYDGWWRRERAVYLRANPLCVCCQANGFVRAAALVDHIVPHRGDKRLFRDVGNRQGLCEWCHNRIKKVVEAAWEAGKVGREALGLARAMPEYFDTGGLPPGGGM